MLETLKAAKVPAAAAWTKNLLQIHEEAKHNLQAAKDRQKSYADSKRLELLFKVGDQVLLSTANLKQNLNTHRKLLPKWVGPFPVTRVVSDVAYTLELPPSYVQARVHPTFHVSLLKPYRSDGRVHPPPPPVTVDGELEYEVEDILQVRSHFTNQRAKKDGTLTKGREHKEYLINWVGYGYEHCTWEPESNLTNCQDLFQAFWQHQALLQKAKDTEQRRPAGRRTPSASSAAGRPSKRHRGE